ncbi:MAG: hypothetical protein ACOCSK_00345 [Rhodothermales bacterium]
MSKAERRSWEIDETRRMVLARYGGKCKLCDRPATQCGHVLPQDKLHLARYGERIIHHPTNLEPVCGLAHNAAVQINYRSRPIEADEWAAYVALVADKEEL